MQPDHWNKNAKHWDLIGSPLRPAPEDIRVLEQVVEQWHETNRVNALQAVLLGVTPEIALMHWPPDTRLVAVDRSQAMIDEIWPGERPGHTALCAEWLDLPLPDRSQDVVVGDGCFSALVNRSEYRAMVRAVRRVIRDNGLFLMRFFIRPQVQETVAAVVDDLWQGRIGNFHVFKWRLAMALHGSLDEGVRLADIWDAWRAAIPEPEQLASRLGWPLQVILTVEAYRGVETHYTFPTLTEARAAAMEAFSEVECIVPGYEMGDRCPTIIFKPC